MTPRGDAHAALTILEPSLEPSTTSTDVGTPLIEVFATEEFNGFWDVYPRHTGGRREARKAWDKAINYADPRTIIGAAALFRDDPNRDDQFTPHPTTWLNQHRWDDDPLPARSGGTSGTSMYVDAAREFTLSADWPPLSVGQA